MSACQADVFAATDTSAASPAPTHYTSPITVEEIAASVNLSPSYFTKLFKEATSFSPYDYLLHVRLEKAKELLEDMTVNIKDVGSSVGYRDSNYFTKVFKRIVGVTPTEYRTQKLM